MKFSEGFLILACNLAFASSFPSSEVPQLSIRDKEKNQTCLTVSIDLKFMIAYTKENSENATIVDIDVPFENYDGACDGETLTDPISSEEIAGPVLFSRWSTVTKDPSENIVVFYFDVDETSKRLAKMQANIIPQGDKFPDADSSATDPVMIGYEFGQTYSSELPGSFKCSTKRTESNVNGNDFQVSNFQFDIGKNLSSTRYAEGAVCNGATSIFISIFSITIAFVISLIV